MPAIEIQIPYAPRAPQLAMHRGFWPKRWGAAVCHRRLGKTVFGVNHLLRGAVDCRRERPRFAYLAPTYAQGKAVAWDYLKHYAAPIPGHRVNESELRIDHRAGWQVRIFGADHPDSLRGLYFDGVIFDEYGLMRANLFSEVIRPALSDREGWAFFMGTPNGRNQFYTIVEDARAHPETWFLAEYKASQTGILSEAELASARQQMTHDEYQQEYECSFDAAVRGAVLVRELAALREQGRIAVVPYDPTQLVDTAWDIGHDDATAIWFVQGGASREVRVIDYHEDRGHGLPHYVGVLTSKGYTYGTHYAPHDAGVTEWGSGRTREEVAAGLGVPFRVVPRQSLDDGLHAMRMLLPRCAFDGTRCAVGLDSLQNYRYREGLPSDPDATKPLHDWASHAADALRCLAQGYQDPRWGKPKPKRETDDEDLPPAYRFQQRQQRRGRGFSRGGY